MYSGQGNRILSLSAVGVLVWAVTLWAAPLALADPLDGASDGTDSVSDAASDASESASDAVSDASDTASDTASDVSGSASDTGSDLSDAVDDATDAVADTAEDAADAVDAATGGATGDVTDPVVDAINDAEETVDETVDDTVGDATDAVDDATDTVGEVIGGEEGSEGGDGGNGGGGDTGETPDAGSEVITDTDASGTLGAGKSSRSSGSRSDNVLTDPSGTPTAGGEPDALTDPAMHWVLVTTAAGPDGSPRLDKESAQANPGLPGRATSVTDALSGITIDPAAAAIGAVGAAIASDTESGGWLPGAIERAADIARRLAFPLALTVLVIAFLTIQGRIDRKDPKLATAPVDPDQDTIYFE